MAARILLTLGALGLALTAFWGDAFGLGWRVNPFGVLFLLLAIGIWFGWGALRDGYKSGRAASTIVGPMMDPWQGPLLMRFVKFGNRDPQHRTSSHPKTN